MTPEYTTKQEVSSALCPKDSLRVFMRRGTIIEHAVCQIKTTPTLRSHQTVNAVGTGTSLAVFLLK